jgi:HK97 family phage major capsid protein
MDKLLEQRNRAAAQARSILEAAGPEGMTAEQEQSFDAAMADHDRLNATLERAQRIATLEAPVSTGVATGGTGSVEKPAEQRAFEAFIRHGVTASGLVPVTDNLEHRAQGVATGSAGGFLVPAGFRDAIIRARKAFGGIRAVAQVISTGAGNDLTYPTLDDTGNTGEWIGENTAVTEQDVVVGNKTLKAHKASSKLVRVANELLQDEEYDLETQLGGMLGERIGRLEAPAWINGDGVGKPTGFLASGTVGVALPTGNSTGFASSAVAFDALIDLEHSLNQAYRAGAAYVMNDLTVAKVRKVKDADGRPIWQPSLAVGAPSTINGYPVVTDPAMPEMAASARSIAFGNWSEAYVIRDVLEFAVRRLTERYAEFDQTGFVGFTRTDGQVQQALAYRVLTNSAT